MKVSESPIDTRAIVGPTAVVPACTTAPDSEKPLAVQSDAPLVSIGLNCYKAERWIVECLDSLLAQTLQDFEIIISDNASTDRTFEICEAYAARDPRIRAYQADRNIGISASLNRVMGLARGKYFCWASANDYYAPKFLENCVRPMQEDPRTDLVASQQATFEKDMLEAHSDGKSFLGTTDGGADQVISLLKTVRDGRMFRGVFRRQALLPMMPLSSRFGMDISLVADVAARGRVRLLDEEPYYFSRIAPGAATHKVPVGQRVAHYEPEDGLRAYLLHRSRNQLTFWRITWRAATTWREKLRAVLGMFQLSWQWRSDPYLDLRDIAGLIRDYVRTWWSRS